MNHIRTKRVTTAFAALAAASFTACAPNDENTTEHFGTVSEPIIFDFDDRLNLEDLFADPTARQWADAVALLGAADTCDSGASDFCFI